MLRIANKHGFSLKVNSLPLSGEQGLTAQYKAAKKLKGKKKAAAYTALGLTVSGAAVADEPTNINFVESTAEDALTNFGSAQAAETGVVDKAKSWPIEHPWLTGGAATGATAATKPGRKLLGKAFRTLGTRAAAVPFAAWTISDNLKKGENVADAVVDPLVGAELMLPNLFKENVAKITSNPTLQKLLKVGKYGRMFTPIGAGITAAGLGIDAYKYGKKRIAELQAMSPEQRAELRRQADDFSFGEYSGAAEGGIMGLKKKW